MNEREILKNSIEDLKRAIGVAEDRLGDLEITYSIGDRFEHRGNKYILAATSAYKRVTLVCLNRDAGYVWSGDYYVADLHQITKEEFRRIESSGEGEFIRYWDNRRKVSV